jgi:hypothetical protein
MLTRGTSATQIVRMPSPSPTNHEPRARNPLALVATAVLVGLGLGVLFAVAIHFVMNEPEGSPFTRTALQQSLFFGLWGAIVVPLWLVFGAVERIEAAALRVVAIVALGVVVWLVHATVLYSLGPL